jgi:hypothetical protein
MNAYYVFLKFAKLWELQNQATKHTKDVRPRPQGNE